MRVFTALFSRYAGAYEANEVAGDRKRLYAFAVDDASRLLKPDERQALRQTGQVPPWFLPEVERGYEQLKRSGT